MSSQLPRAGRGRRHRRRRDRHQRRLPPDQARPHRRGAARAGPALLRHHLARRRSRRAAARQPERHPAGAVLDPALLRARGGGRPGHRLQAVRRRDGGAHRGPDDPAASYGGDGSGLRPRVRAALPRGGAGALPGDAGGRPRRRDLAARRRQGQPDRPDGRAGQGRPAAGRADPREDPRARRARRGGAGHRRPHGRRRHRGRGGRQLRRPVGQGRRRARRGERAAALGRALLRRDRPVRGSASRPAGAARPGRLHLLQGGGRRPGRGRLRARREAVGVAGPDPLPVRVLAARGGLGALLAADGERRAPRPGARGDRDPQVLQRARELHPGQPVHPRRGAGGAELLRRGRPQLGRHRVCRWGRAGAGGVDRRRRADHGPDQCRRTPLRAVQRQQPVAARPRRGDPRPALRDPVAQPRDADGATVPSLAALRPPGGGERELRQPQRLGARQLLRAVRLGAGDRVRVGQAELAALDRGRARATPART